VEALLNVGTMSGIPPSTFGGEFGSHLLEALVPGRGDLKALT
jgi:hypothetical protein